MSSTRHERPIEVLILALQGEAFGVKAHHVHEILDPVPITEVPGAGSFLGGLINVRGKVVPMADLRVKLGMHPAPPTIDTRIVVVEVALDGEPTLVGLLADKVYEIRQIAAGLLEDAPHMGMRWRTEVISCIGKCDGDFLIVLDLESIFDDRTAPAASAATTRPALALIST